MPLIIEKLKSLGYVIALNIMQFDNHFKEFDRAYATTLKTMEVFAKDERIRIYDLNPGLQRAIKEQFLFLSDSDAHFNTEGVQVLYSLIEEQVHALLNGSCVRDTKCDSGPHKEELSY